MPKYLITLKKKSLSQIIVHCSTYNAGSIIIDFNPDDVQITLLQTLFIAITSCPVIRVYNSLIIPDVANVKPVLSSLLSQNLIAEEDELKIATLISAVDKLLGQRTSLKGSMDLFQKETLLATAEIYVDDIIENCNDLKVVFILLRCAFSPTTIDILLQITKFLKEKNVDETMIESIKALWKMCHGLANYENHYQRTDSMIPTLLAQRIAIYTMCIDKLKEKLKSIPDEQQLLNILGFIIFKSENCPLSPLDNTDDILKIALSEQIPQVAKSPIFERGTSPGLLPLVSFSLGVMNLLPANESRLQRIQALQHTFKSTLLASYVTDLKKIGHHTENKEHAELVLALNSKDKLKVRTALSKNKLLVNQYLWSGGQSSGLTSLHMACQIDSNMVDIIFEFNPDVNKPNEWGFYTAIDIAIRKPNRDILNKLIKAGAQLFTYCGVTIAKSAIFNPHPGVTGSVPIMIATEIYNQEKTAERREVLKTLIQSGAAIGAVLDVSCSDLLDKAVVIGATFSCLPNINPITTATQFKKNIGVETYPYWEKVLLQALAWEPFQSNHKMIAEIKSIMKHIQNTLLTSNGGSKPPAPRAIGSPVTVTGEAHDLLIKRSLFVVKGDAAICQPYFDAINRKAYAAALRCACNWNNHRASDLVKILFEFKKVHEFDINAKAGNLERSAAHYAASNPYSEIYELLVANKADVHSTDKNSETPAQLREKFLLSNSK